MTLRRYGVSPTSYSMPRFVRSVQARERSATDCWSSATSEPSCRSSRASRPRAKRRRNDAGSTSTWPEGSRQAQGTIRKLTSGPARMTNGRGRTIDLVGSSLRWLAVIVVDHPAVPSEVITAVDDQPNPSVVILRRDWEFLFDQLKSTYSVTRYLERVAGEASELGNEPVRYFRLAQADEEAPRVRSTYGCSGPTGAASPRRCCLCVPWAATISRHTCSSDRSSRTSL